MQTNPSQQPIVRQVSALSGVKERDSEDERVKTFARSMSKQDLKNRLYEVGPPKRTTSQLKLTTLPSVINNSKGKPMRGTGLQFCPPRHDPKGISRTSNQIILNKQQSAFLAGASRNVIDAFSNEDLIKLQTQKDYMFQSIEDVQQMDLVEFDEEKEKGLHLQVPSAQVLFYGKSHQAIPTWKKQLSDQLSRFKNSQKDKMYPHRQHMTAIEFVEKRTLLKSTTAAQLTSMQSQTQLMKINPQFQSLNIEPYIRPTTTIDNKSAQDRFMGSLQVSNSIKSLGGLQLRTALGPKSHFHKPSGLAPHMVGQIPGSSAVLPKKTSQNFLDHRKSTSSILKKPHHTVTDSEATVFIPTQMTERVLPSLADRMLPQNLAGQSEAAEEKLRQHYYIAKSTKRTSHQTLEKPGSPMKHLNKGQDNDRLERLENIQIQAASLMRLNALWGLEKNDPTIDVQKATIDPAIAQGEGVFVDGLPQSNRLTNNSPVSDLDMMISLFMRQPEDNGYFIYLQQGSESENNPFDLKPMLDYIRPRPDPKAKKSYKNNQLSALELNVVTYYTLSKKGITQYIRGVPQDYESLNDWLLARANFLQISNQKFFKNFRKWKLIKMWHRNIIFRKREEIKQVLSDKLFLIDDTFGNILIKHRQICKEMESLRVLTLQSAFGDVATVSDFLQSQEKHRKTVQKIIVEKADQSRMLFNNGMKEVLENLRKKVLDKNDNDDKSSQGLSKTEEVGKTYPLDLDGGFNSILAELKFPQNLKYGTRSELRKNVSRFFRFSYLMDFIATQSLSNIQLQTIQDTVDKLDTLSSIPIDFHFKTQVPADADFGDFKRTESAPMNSSRSMVSYDGGQTFQPQILPFLQVQAKFNEQLVPRSKTQKHFINSYQPPPVGKSVPSDFNPTVHLKLSEEEKLEEQIDLARQEFTNVFQKEEARYVESPDKLWLNVEPTSAKMQSIFIDCFIDGKSCLLAYKRFSRHPQLERYLPILQSWDDKVCDSWEPLSEDQMHLNCEEWLLESTLYQQHASIINQFISQAYYNIEIFYKSYIPYLHLYWENKMCGTFEILRSERLHNPTESIWLLLQRLNSQKQMFEECLPDMKDLGMFRLETSDIKSKIAPQPKQCALQLKVLIPQILQKRIQECNEWLNNQLVALKAPTQTVDAYVKQIQTLDYIDLAYQDVKDKVDLSTQIFSICLKFEIFGKEERHRRFLDEAAQLVYQLNREISYAREMADRRKLQIKQKITLKVPKLNNMTKNFLAELEDQKYLDITSNLQANLIDIAKNEEVCQKLKQKKDSIQNYQRKLDMGEITTFEIVEQAQHNHLHRQRLWRALDEWTSLVTKWEGTIFEQIDVASISQISDQYQKTVIQCERNLPPQSTAVQQLKTLVTAFKNTMPIVEALGNRNLMEFHWLEIKKLIQTPIDFKIEERKFTLGKLVELRADRQQEEITNISITATQEFNLNNQIKDVKNVWNVTEFEVVKHKDKEAYKLTGIDFIQSNLDESLSKVSDIQGNRYVKRLAADVESLQERLILMSETLEQWKECQRNWLYLENIFSSADIRKQRLKDFTDFDVVSRQWTKLMKKVFTKPLVKANCNAARLQDFVKYNQAMEKIIKNLDVFLEEKRSEFPRFYFISNDELLQLLAHQQNINELNRHLNKCFDNIKNLGVIESGNVISEVVTMISSEGEHVDLMRSIKLRNSSIEVWLRQVEEEMCKTVQRKIRDAYTQQTKGGTSKKEQVLKHCAQGVSVSSMILWTEMTEYAIVEMDDNPFSLNEQLKVQQDELKGLVELIRQNLTSVQRRILVSLITADVHSRDIVSELMNDLVESISDFKWLQQLRYYQDEEVVYVRQVNANFAYGNEYMGATSRLVITPLTDRCWLTITGALQIKLGASPAGPAGTGKTESTKDLAKALGTFCVVFNCSDQVEYKIMARLFSGLAQSGSWACLDEFNRIDVEVLSVIAQQLLDIRQAKLANKTTFCFNDRENMPLKQSCGIFVTMNPGYAGRTELPDNLKVLFRPVSMMIPSYGLIAEVMLFAEGFVDAKRLSTKMVKLYKLASEQLSQQDHYDFGMRAVKSVLVTAGNLKRQNPNQSENVVLIRAMRDSNIPKFLAEDLPLFQALIQDLFPGVEVPRAVSDDLDVEIARTMASQQLMSLESFHLKVLQLHDTMKVRFGVMMVGPTGGGKTTCHKILLKTLTKLSQTDSASHNPIKSKILNPKSVSMGELYGQENEDTKEWTDGLASKMMRKFANATDNRHYWIVFDGPVDALWIENMNTVLDDNMTLCLASGERIKLRQEMRLIFEVQDLAVASPATVSRCGMVYMTPINLGWKPFQVQWFQVFLFKKGNEAPILSQESIDLLDDLFDQFIEECLTRLETVSQEMQLPCKPIQIVRNICNYLEYFIENTSAHPKPDNKEGWFKYIYAIFGYSMIWSIGGYYKPQAMRFLDNMLREFFSRLLIPLNDSVFEYYFDEKKLQFYHWKEFVPEFEYPQVPTPFFSLVVPTVDTLRYSNHLKILTKISKPVYITGETGTGKSMIVQDFISANAEAMEFITINLNFSAQTDSASTQNNIESKLEKKRKKSRGAKGTLKTLIFIDDINMPAVEQFGAQPPIELLRQLIEQKGFYDRQQLFWKEIEKFTVVCAAAPSGGGRSSLSQRFMNHFIVLNVPESTEETLTLIFESILGGFLQQNMFGEKIKRNQPKVAVCATIDLYLQITKNLLPIPAKFHYTFNLRDISKVFQGILQANPVTCQDNEAFSKLWMHECSRVFADRLVAGTDKEFYRDLVAEILKMKFKADWAEKKELIFQNEPIFSVIMKIDHDVQTYDPVLDRAALHRMLQDKLTDYNFAHASKMNLVFFEDAVVQLCSVLRILSQPRGNAMLIGVSGSGKQSLTKLAANMLEHHSFQLQLSKNFRQADFREAIRIRMIAAGCDALKTTFILTDTQIMHESFLEDVNNILNTGEITNIYNKEDFDRMSDSLSQSLAKQKIPQTKDNIYNEYIKQLRNNFHCILCMSPVGDQLRIRCRMFPSLVNCCTLIWFSSWPQEALTSVANQYLSNLTGETKKALIILFPKIHSSVEEAADRFFQVTRRKTYITPKSYLDGIILFLNLMSEQRQKQSETMSRLENGVSKLQITNVQIAELQIKLTELRPRLEIQEATAMQQAALISQQKEIALDKETEAEEEAAIVREEATKIEVIKQEAEVQLLAAQPALEAANKAVDQLNKEDVFELKAVKNPNAATELALSCILTYLGYVKVDWASAQKAMTDINFLQKIKHYDKENIPAPILKKVNLIVSDKKEFNIEAIMRSSKAAGGMAKWCLALQKYAEVLKVVRPKELKAAEMQEKFRNAMAEVELKHQAVLTLKHQVKEMEEELKKTTDFIKHLKQEKQICETRLTNADKLISLLGDEGKRWQERINQMQEDGKFSAGDIFLAAAELSYLGPFNGQYRAELVDLWRKQCNEINLPTSEKYSLVNTLGDQVKIRDWILCGLPSDTVSIDNAILCTYTQRWPIMIDPQTQANTWIKRLAASDNQPLIILTQSSGSSQNQMQKKLEFAIVTGKTVLLEEVGESIDPGLDSIMNRQIYKEEGIDKIRFGDKSLIYDHAFKFMLTTKIQNPHFLPEICIKLIVINFTVTFAGLEEQMLADVVKYLSPEVEERRDQLVIQLAKSRNDLYKLQSKILSELAASNAETILDNIILIETLEICKTESVTIVISLIEAERVEDTINQTRNQYRVIAKRGSILYFAVCDLSLIDPMYQNSLVYVKKLFNDAIKSVDKEEQSSHEELVKSLLFTITLELYQKISIGLFESHKLIFALLICTSIQKQDNLIDVKEWGVFIRGPSIDQESPEKHPYWLNDYQWKQASQLKGFQEHLVENGEKWRQFIASDQVEILAANYENSLTPFQNLLVIKILKPEMTQFACQKYLRVCLGHQFAINPSITLGQIFQSADQFTPIIFILSQGVDPTNQILSHAQWQGFKDKLYTKSLGQGQEKIAESMIQKAMQEGSWVLLQNCHLFKSWMSRLDTICNEISSQTQEINPEFRLILTSMPAPYFPISILQNSLKMTTDPPKGIRANIKRTYSTVITQEIYDGVDFSKQSLDQTTQAFGQTQYSDSRDRGSSSLLRIQEKKRIWQNLLFSLSFFHAVILERRKFGPHGWNINYQFSDSDLQTSITMLKHFLQENDEIPWDSIKFMTGKINYGGRVTDDFDKVLLMNILNIYQNDDVVQMENLKFSPSGIYYVPKHNSISDINEYIDSLPYEDAPEVFGMQQNANLTYLKSKSAMIIDTILNVQPRQFVSTQGKSSDEQVTELAIILQSQVPYLILAEHFAKEILKTNAQGLLSCLSTVLMQEVQRYNRLVEKLNSSLDQLIKAVKGIVIMSQELDLMFAALLNNRVPSNWESMAYPSLKKLGSWILDLKDRVNFMKEWATKGHPKSFWLSGFFFPHGFITGVLQTYARKYQQPIDQLQFQFEIKDFTSPLDVKCEPKEGVYIYGLFLENARWSKSKSILIEARPGEMSFVMPMIHFKQKVLASKTTGSPAKGADKRSKTDDSEEDMYTYQCPIYKTSLRAGVLSTTGQSTNFILAVDLPCGSSDIGISSDKAYNTGQTSQSTIIQSSAEHWTLRGTALLTMLDE